MFHFFIVIHCQVITILYHKNRCISLIIILKFHALILLRLEENCKISLIVLICWLPDTSINNHLLPSLAVYSLKTAPHYSKETVSKKYPIYYILLLLLREKHGVFLPICLFLLITKVFIKFKRFLFDKSIRSGLGCIWRFWRICFTSRA